MARFRAAALRVQRARADATVECVVCGEDEATRRPCRGCGGSLIQDDLVTVDCSNANIVPLSDQPLDATLPEGTGRQCVGSALCACPAPLLEARAALTPTRRCSRRAPRCACARGWRVWCVSRREACVG